MINALIIVGLLSAMPAPTDSIGVETINGKLFVIHKVDEKETLYAISRRYGTTVEEVVKYNPGSDQGLEIGRILKVPFAPKPTVPQSSGNVHVVAAGETLFSISRKYGATVDDIRRWNKLTSDEISIGQQLVITQGKTIARQVNLPAPDQSSAEGFHRVAPQETLYSLARQYGVTVAQLKEWNSLESADLPIGQVIRVVAPANATAKQEDTATETNTQMVAVKAEESKPKDETTTKETEKQTVVQPHTIRISESVKNGSETVESGVAELIEGTEGNRKYLALHRTAPIGSILKVRNEMNNREVFVRVMGKLPDTALTDKVLIRISKSAYDRLGAIDQRFRVQVTYYK